MDAGVQEDSRVLSRARKNGKGIVGMKLVAAGKLVEPRQMDASLQNVMGHNLVDAVTIGMTKPAQVNDTIARINRAIAS